MPGGTEREEVERETEERLKGDRQQKHTLIKDLAEERE